ncbi:MAG: dihydroorotase [Candidatus Moranbacteria bacterium CG_4_8_14_3_um_filter_43_15]|nr:MAG: dihydroorotase [Candidatus Moranbacteria bacterium CG_4_8_14_3_um_filter_43_15]
MLDKKMRIDPHVHCRDGKQSYKETIKHAFEVASFQGVTKIFDMPNTDPLITTERHVQERLKLVPKERINDYYIWIGVTVNERQLKEAVKCWENYKNVIGLKMFAGRSVGDLTVAEKNDQKKVYEILAGLDYPGVIAVHCEKESFLKNDLWNPKNLITHAEARPKESEIESIKDQIELAKGAEFSGTLHICHISSPESVELVEVARSDMKMTCGVTPHHTIWSDEMLARPDGLLYKMNPPLRDRESVEKLREYLRKGKIDWIETDHAPHAVGEKMFEPYMSGYPSLYLYKNFMEDFLPGIGVSQELIEKMTSGNIYKTFGDKLK